jgi:hypothetical protein
LYASVIEALISGGAKIPWKNVALSDGRTPQSAQRIIGLLLKNDNPSTPVAGAKRKSTKGKASDGGDDEEDGAPAPPPKKKRVPRKPTAAKAKTKRAAGKAPQAEDEEADGAVGVTKKEPVEDNAEVCTQGKELHR